MMAFSNLVALSRTARILTTSRVLHSAAQEYASSSMEGKYNFIEERSIVKKINKSTTKQLVKLSFYSEEADLLKKYRIENGPFKNITDLLKVPNLRPDRVHEVCSKLYEGIKETSGNISKIITPKLELDEPLENVVGIITGVDSTITWAEMTSANSINSWGQVDMNGTKVKLTPHAINESVQLGCEQIPPSKVYLFEMMPALMPQQAFIQSYLERKVTQAMLLTALNMRPPDRNKVFFIRSKFPVHLFDLKVGNERISSRPLVTKLLQGERAGRNNDCYLSDIRQEIYSSFNRLSGVEQEAYSNAVVLAMTFLKLVPSIISSTSDGGTVNDLEEVEK